MEMELRAFRELLERIAGAGMARLELLELDDVDSESTGETIDDTITKRRLADAVSMAMETLPAKLLQVLALYYQEALTFRQIGAVLGVGESRVSQLHAEAIHRLRAAVEKE
jgi:RNA polymerase sigma factor for flagellar operon FliA